MFKENYRDYKGDGPNVLRFGILSKKYSDIIGLDTTEHKILHPAELCVLIEGIKYLNSRANVLAPEVRGFSDYFYKENVVLCDIFARDKDNHKIKEDKDSPEIHTIVLWKTSGGEFMIIDPSNLTYSNFLIEKVLMKGVKLSASFAEETKEKVKVKGKSEGFYLNHGEEPSREEDGVRDCIDIAVKIAFEINEIQKKETDTNKILELLFNKMSNSGGGKHDLKLLRDAHRSSSSVREKFYEFFRAYSETIDNNPKVHRKLTNILKK